MLIYYYYYYQSPPQKTGSAPESRARDGRFALSGSGKEKTAAGPLTLRGSPIQLCKSFSKPPSSPPPKLPSPNNRLKAIRLSLLFSVYFILSLPFCTSSLNHSLTPDWPRRRWRKKKEALVWPGGGGGGGVVPHAWSQGLAASGPCERLADT